MRAIGGPVKTLEVKLYQVLFTYWFVHDLFIEDFTVGKALCSEEIAVNKQSHSSCPHVAYNSSGRPTLKKHSQCLLFVDSVLAGRN